MAKSIRSKWKRKCRAVKRERYGKKELERLKKTLGIDSEVKPKNEDSIDISEIANVTTVEDIKKAGKDNEEVMEVDVKPTKFNVKSLRDKNGAYPIWLHPRKIKTKSKKTVKKSKKLKRHTKKK